MSTNAIRQGSDTGSAIGVGFRLNNTIALTEMDSFSVVKFQNHFPVDDDTVVKGIRGVHSGSITFEVLSHPRDLLWCRR
jgi:hypothetical protein